MYRDKSGLYLPERYDPTGIVPGIFMVPRPAIVASGPPVAPISVIGYLESNSSVSSITAPGTIQSGDLVVIFSVWRDDQTPNLGASCTDIAYYTDTSFHNARIRGMYRYATSSSLSITGLTSSSNARHLAITLRGTRSSSPIGDFDGGRDGGPDFDWPDLTLDAGGDSIVLAACVSGSASVPTTPDGMTATFSDNRYGLFYMNPASTFTGKSSSFSGSSDLAYMAVEVLAP